VQVVKKIPYKLVQNQKGGVFVMLEGMIVKRRGGITLMTVTRINAIENRACCIWCDKLFGASYGKWFDFNEFVII